VFAELHRVLRPGGLLLIVAKEGDGESWIDDPLGVTDKVFWSAMTLEDLQGIAADSGFTVVGCEARDPFAHEIDVRRIYLTAERVR